MAIAGLKNVLRNISFLDLNGCMVDVEAFARDPIDARHHSRLSRTIVSNRVASTVFQCFSSATTPAVGCIH